MSSAAASEVLLGAFSTRSVARVELAAALDVDRNTVLAAYRQLRDAGVLTELTCAFSRDQRHKVYVQDRLREQAARVWNWIDSGAHFYVCGDAKRMAKDVERALVDIVAQFGARTTDEAVSFVGELKKQGRFQQDVY